MCEEPSDLIYTIRWYGAYQGRGKAEDAGPPPKTPSALAVQLPRRRAREEPTAELPEDLAG